MQQYLQLQLNLANKGHRTLGRLWNRIIIYSWLRVLLRGHRLVAPWSALGSVDILLKEPAPSFVVFALK